MNTMLHVTTKAMVVCEHALGLLELDCTTTSNPACCTAELKMQ